MSDFSIHKVLTKQLSPNISVIWFRYNDQEIQHHRPHVGTYLNNELVSTVYWNEDQISPGDVEQFLRTNELNQRLPGWSPCPFRPEEVPDLVPPTFPVSPGRRNKPPGAK